MSNQESPYQKQNTQPGQQAEKKDFKRPEQEQKAKMGNGNGNKNEKTGNGK